MEASPDELPMSNDDDLYSDLPEDHELAFLKLEDIFRKELFVRTKQTPPSPIHYIQYLNKTHAAARALELPVLEKMEGPNVTNAANLFAIVSPEIENYIIQTKIRHGRRAKGYSVALDAITKEKVRHLISQIRSIVDRLEIDVRKKEALYARITALNDEVDRERTKYDAYAGLAIEISNTAGKVARNLRPASRLLDAIGKLLGAAKDAEVEKPQLRLEAPRLQLTPPSDGDPAQSE